MSLNNSGLGTETNSGSKTRTLTSEIKGKGVLPQRKAFQIGELPELPKEDRELEDNGERLQENGKTFQQMLDESQKGIKFQEGEVVEGIVVNANRDYVTIDIGYKSEGQISAQEFLDNKGEL